MDCAGFSALKLSELTPFFLSSVIFQQSSVFILIVKSEQSEGHTDKQFSKKASAGRNNEKETTEAFPPLPSILCPSSLPDKSLFMLKVREIRCVYAGNVNYFQPGQNQAIHMCQTEMVG